jgi:hypothetical protein
MSNARDSSKPPSEAAGVEPQPGGRELLASLLSSSAFAGHAPTTVPAGGCLVGICVESRHPTSSGRALIQWNTVAGVGDAWLPVLQSVVVRSGDQVLLSQPLNGPEPVVIGVVDGFAHRPPPPERTALALTLQNDEVLRVEDATGRPLLEVRAGEDGPAVRLLRDNLALEVQGKLAFRAESIRMEARRGAVEIVAADDVCVRGEVVHLN